MEIADFLQKHVEGYLFADLDAMARVTATPGRAGAVVYPMIQTALAGVELLGGLVQDWPFDPRAGDRAFEHFWKELYPSPPHCKLAKPVYQLVRHGLAHVFLAKPGILATKDGDPARHLRRDADGSLRIDALVLAADLREAYRTAVVPLIGVAGGSRANNETMQRRLDEMIAAYSEQSRQVAPVWQTVESAPPADPKTTQVNSPTVNSTYRAGTHKRR